MVSLSNHGLMLGVVCLASEDLTGADPSTGPIHRDYRPTVGAQDER